MLFDRLDGSRSLSSNVIAVAWQCCDSESVVEVFLRPDLFVAEAMGTIPNGAAIRTILLEIRQASQPRIPACTTPNPTPIRFRDREAPRIFDKWMIPIRPQGDYRNVRMRV